MLASTKLLLLVLAALADPETREIGETVSKLAQLTELDRKTIITALRILTGRGLIEDTGKRRGATKRTIVYRLNLTAAKESQNRNNSGKEIIPKVYTNRPAKTQDSAPSQVAYPVPEYVPIRRKIARARAKEMVEFCKAQVRRITEAVGRDGMVRVGGEWRYPDDAQNAIDKWSQRITEIERMTEK